MEKLNDGQQESYFFEILTFFVFSMIIGTKVTVRHWPDIKKAFNNFDVVKVANFTEKDIQRFLGSPKVIKNLKKADATVQNAQEFIKIEQQFGSFKNYLYSFNTEGALIDDLNKRIHYIGKPSIKRYIKVIER